MGLDFAREDHACELNLLHNASGVDLHEEVFGARPDPQRV